MVKFNLSNFLRDERGAVTVDWVMITAAVVGMAILVYSNFSVDTDNTYMWAMAQTDPATGEFRITRVEVVGDNGISKILAKLHFYGTAYSTCIFGGIPDVELATPAGLDTLCDYLLG